MKHTIATVSLAVAALLAAAATAPADTVWVSSGGKPLEYKGVKVIGMDKGQLTFRTASSGRETTRPIEQFAQIALDDDPAFTAAEKAYVDKDWKGAATGYQKVVGATKVPWVKDRATFRLIEAAEKSGDFGAAVAGYVQLLQRDPALAAKSRPEVPKDKPEAVKPAIPDVEKASQDTKFKPAQKQALQALLMEMKTAVGDTRGAGAIAEQITKQPGTRAGDPDNATDGGDGSTEVPPEVLAAQAQAQLQLARSALDEKNYKKALSLIDSKDELFTDSAHQLEALFYRAEALAGSAKTDDEKALKDAALAYMRVVAHFKDRPDAPQVAESLLKTGAILERLNALPEALSVYEQATKELKGGDSQKAAEGARRVKEALAAAK